MVWVEWGGEGSLCSPIIYKSLFLPPFKKYLFSQWGKKLSVMKSLLFPVVPAAQRWWIWRERAHIAMNLLSLSFNVPAAPPLSCGLEHMVLYTYLNSHVWPLHLAGDTVNLICPPLSQEKIRENRDEAVLGVKARAVLVLLLKTQHLHAFLLYDTLYAS